MVKVVVASLKPKSKTHGPAASASEKRVRGSGGRLKTLRVLDIGSRTFGDDLRDVFAKNVAKARRDNKGAIGSTDVALAKP